MKGITSSLLSLRKVPVRVLRSRLTSSPQRRRILLSGTTTLPGVIFAGGGVSAASTRAATGSKERSQRMRAFLLLGRGLDGDGDRVRRHDHAHVGAARPAGVGAARVVARGLAGTGEDEAVSARLEVRRQRQFHLALGR